LENIHNNLEAKDHLRSDGHTLYAKSSGKHDHGKTHFWGGKRKQKFQAAKQEVLRRLSDALGGNEKAARQIMKPFLNSSRALTKTDLGNIITAAKSHQKQVAQAKAKAEAFQTQLIKPQGQPLASPPKVQSQNPESDYTAVMNWMDSSTGRFLAASDPDLNRSFQFVKLAEMDGDYDNEIIEDMLSKLAQKGYTPEQIRIQAAS
jgi:hypothetical protein